MLIFSKSEHPILTSDFLILDHPQSWEGRRKGWPAGRGPAHRWDRQRSAGHVCEWAQNDHRPAPPGLWKRRSRYMSLSIWSAQTVPCWRCAAAFKDWMLVMVCSSSWHIQDIIFVGVNWNFRFDQAPTCLCGNFLCWYLFVQLKNGFCYTKVCCVSCHKEGPCVTIKFVDIFIFYLM